MPQNPNNKVFIHAHKRTHKVMVDVFNKPGKWGVMSISKKHSWDHNDAKKVINKLVLKGLIVVARTSKKLYLTDKGKEVLDETNWRCGTTVA